jgi:transglutaminase-like putative cysteine protease
MDLKVYHRTEYRYSSPARESVNELKLRPPDTKSQRCEDALISVLPAAPLRPMNDLYGNRGHHVEIPEPHLRFIVEARLRIHTSPPLQIADYPYGVAMSSLKGLSGREDCHLFLQGSTYVEVNPKVWRRAVDIMNESTDVFQTSYQLMKHVFENFSYLPGSTVVTTHANEVIDRQVGVCQDFAHAMVAFCRSLRIPARYVSGYFFDTTRDHRLRGSEATHAWVEVFVEGHGWVGLDPTNNKVVDDTYIVLAVGRDYADVAPVSGSYFGGGTSRLIVHVAVRRLDSSRRLDVPPGPHPAV